MMRMTSDSGDGGDVPIMEETLGEDLEEQHIGKKTLHFESVMLLLPCETSEMNICHYGPSKNKYYLNGLIRKTCSLYIPKLKLGPKVKNIVKKCARK